PTATAQRAPFLPSLCGCGAPRRHLRPTRPVPGLRRRLRGPPYPATMNIIKSALLSGHRPHSLTTVAVAAAAPQHQQLGGAASFHSTPILQRKRKTQWHNRFNYYTKRRRNRENKRTLLRNMSEYAEHLFQSWRDEEEKTDSEDEVSTPSEVYLARQALGLSTSGPLKLEDVKSAYRACALRWHPDRHNGSSKATAEEKFKHCSAAYQTLCDSLAAA
ncbi:unnamed protein product, partial [Urochloa humidicola]